MNSLRCDVESVIGCKLNSVWENGFDDDEVWVIPLRANAKTVLGKKRAFYNFQAESLLPRITVYRYASKRPFVGLVEGVRLPSYMAFRSCTILHRACIVRNVLFFIHKFIKSFLPFCMSKRAIFLCFVAVKVYEVLEVVAHRHKEPLHEHLQFPRGKSSWAANTVVMRRVGKSIFTQRQRRDGLPIATLRQSTCRYVFPQSQRSRAINSDGIVFKYLRLHKKRLIAACDAEVVFCAFN